MTATVNWTYKDSVAGQFALTAWQSGQCSTMPASTYRQAVMGLAQSSAQLSGLDMYAQGRAGKQWVPPATSPDPQTQWRSEVARNVGGAAPRGLSPHAKAYALAARWCLRQLAEAKPATGAPDAACGGIIPPGEPGEGNPLLWPAVAVVASAFVAAAYATGQAITGLISLKRARTAEAADTARWITHAQMTLKATGKIPPPPQSVQALAAAEAKAQDSSLVKQAVLVLAVAAAGYAAYRFTRPERRTNPRRVSDPPPRRRLRRAKPSPKPPRRNNAGKKRKAPRAAPRRKPKAEARARRAQNPWPLAWGPDAAFKLGEIYGDREAGLRELLATARWDAKREPLTKKDKSDLRRGYEAGKKGSRGQAGAYGGAGRSSAAAAQGVRASRLGDRGPRGTNWTGHKPKTKKNPPRTFKPGQAVKVGKAYRMDGPARPDEWTGGPYTVVSGPHANGDYGLARGASDARYTPSEAAQLSSADADVFINAGRLRRARRTRKHNPRKRSAPKRGAGGRWLQRADRAIAKKGTAGSFDEQAARAGYPDALEYAAAIMKSWRAWTAAGKPQKTKPTVQNRKTRRKQGITLKTMRRANFALNAQKRKKKTRSQVSGARRASRAKRR